MRGVDGANSGLDSDRLDGIDSSTFLRADRDAVLAGDLTVRGRMVMAGSEEPPAACDEDSAGALYYNTTEQTFMGCNGEEWGPMNRGSSGGSGGGQGSSREDAAPGCQALLEILTIQKTACTGWT